VQNLESSLTGLKCNKAFAASCANFHVKLPIKFMKTDYLSSHEVFVLRHSRNDERLPCLLGRIEILLNYGHVSLILRECITEQVDARQVHRFTLARHTILVLINLGGCLRQLWYTCLSCLLD